MILRPYQIDAGTAVERALLDQGQNRLLIKSPTGSGKTVWFAALLRVFQRLRAWLDQFPEGERKMLVIAHRDDLLTQAAEKIRAQNPGLMVSIEQADLYANRYADVVIASIQTLAAMKFRRLQRLLRSHRFRIVIVDEAHHAAAATYRTALVHLGFLPPADASDTENIDAASHDDVAAMTQVLESWDLEAPKDRLLIGVTATPNRTDAIGLGCVFQSIAYSYALRQAIEDGWLVPIVPWVVETRVSLDTVKTTAGDFNQKQLAEAVNTDERNQLAVDAWRKYGDNRQTLAFTVDVAHAHNLAAAFRSQGYEFAAIDGTMDKAQKADILRDFKRGNLQGVSNCMLLTEGSDLPMTGCILNAKPTKSATLYEQIVGRGLRLHPDDPAGPDRLQATRADLRKPDCLVIDVVDVARKHSLQTAPILYGLPPGISIKGQELGQVAAALEAMLAQHPRFDLDAALKGTRASIDELTVQASTFDVWAIPSIGDFGVGLVCNWFRIGDETYRLQYPWADGMETLKVERNLLGHFDVSLTLKPYEQGTIRQRTIGADVPEARQALSLAEAFVLQERRSIMKLADREAPWRTRPATPKQKGLLQRYRVPHSPSVTCGEASDLITLAQQRAGR